MMEGRHITEMIEEVNRREKAKKDFVAPTTKLSMLPLRDGGSDEINDVQLAIYTEGYFGIKEHAHSQLADRLKIPKRYYDRMLIEEPGLLCENVNTWFESNPEDRFIRTLDRNVRAFMSSSYRPLDNWLVAKAALPTLQGIGNVTIKSCEITDERMYLQVVTAKLRAEVREGDVVQAGMVISNSEVGKGSVRIEPLIYRLLCANGMIRGFSMKKHHVGRRIDSGDSVLADFYKADTQESANETFLLQMRDTISHGFKEDAFRQEVEQLKETADRAIASPIGAVVQEVTKRFGLSDAEGDEVLARIGNDRTQYGLSNAITNLANDQGNYDRGVEMERIGGKIIDLDPKEWRDLAG